MSDLYQILGVNKDASGDEIKKAYRKLAHKYHPDKTQGDKDLEAKFKEVNNAYEVLGDDKKRTNYDKFGTAEQPGFGGMNGANGGGGMGGFEGFSGSVNMSDFGFDGISDVFEAFFGGGGGSPFGGVRNEKQAARRGIDLESVINITLEEAASGVVKNFEHKHNVKCDLCDGLGFEKGSGVKTCGTCHGKGRVYQRVQTIFGVIQQEVICPTCDGLGKIYEKKCSKCTGKGFNRITENLEIKIPAGVSTGDRIRVTGKGEAGYKGSNPGDLYLAINIVPHKLFKRENLDISSVAEIDYLDLLLGTKLEVETVWGKVEINVPELTTPDGKLRLKNQGMPKLNNATKGDHYLNIKVKMPTKLSEKQRKLIQEIKENKED